MTNYNSHQARNELKITYRPAASLRPHPTNARTHSKKQIRQIASSIEQFGWSNPILIDADGNVIAGHGRLEAAKLLGISIVPTVEIRWMSPAQRRAYMVADNKIAEEAGWDRSILAAEFEAILTMDCEFDLSLTGFGMDEIEIMLDSGLADPADDVPDVDPGGPAVSHLGDLWILGEHRLLCGDAREEDAYRRLLGSEQAQMVFTDPPYNVRIDGHVSGKGKARHGEFVMASGEMSEAEFTAFLGAVLNRLAQHSSNGSIHFVCMDWRHMRELLSAGDAAYTELKNLVVWNKDNGGMGAFYRSKHELVFVFKSGSGRHINNFGLGQHGRYRTNVWDYAGANTLKAGRQEELAMHPTVKPVAMVADAIRDCSRKKGLVLDPFGGSGSTLIAAEQTGRRARLIELDPKYVDVTVRRWQQLTGRAALHESGHTFDHVAVDAGMREALPRREAA